MGAITIGYRQKARGGKVIPSGAQVFSEGKCYALTSVYAAPELVFQHQVSDNALFFAHMPAQAKVIPFRDGKNVTQASVKALVWRFRVIVNGVAGPLRHFLQPFRAINAGRGWLAGGQVLAKTGKFR